MIRRRELTVRWSLALLLLFTALIAWSSVSFFGRVCLLNAYFCAVRHVGRFSSRWRWPDVAWSGDVFRTRRLCDGRAHHVVGCGALVTVPIGIGIAAVVR